MKECERDREFKEWFKKRFYTKSTFDFIEEDEDHINTKAAWEEARKGFVELKKVEEIMEKHNIGTVRRGFVKACVKEIKELEDE